MREVPKPATLAARGGCWFETDDIRVHLGIEQDFRPARKAHPAFLVEDLAGFRSRFEQAGHPTVEGQALEGYDRLYVADPFGNRIELMEALP